MSTTILTDPAAGEIYFECDGEAVIDVIKYTLDMEE